MLGLARIWAILVSNRTNCSTFWLGKPKCTKILSEIVLIFFLFDDNLIYFRSMPDSMGCFHEGYYWIILIYNRNVPEKSEITRRGWRGIFDGREYKRRMETSIVICALGGILQGIALIYLKAWPWLSTCPIGNRHTVVLLQRSKISHSDIQCNLLPLSDCFSYKRITRFCRLI